MSTRLLLEVAIRVLGLWFVVLAISSLPGIASVYLSTIWVPWPPRLPPSMYLISSLLVVVVQGFLGIALTWWAPWIAARFYPPRPEEEQLHLNVGPGDVYRVACFVLGAYLLVQAARPAAQLVLTGMQGISWQHVLADVVTVTVYLIVGTVLVFGSRPISQLLSNLRYDPDTIPRQQISLAVVLLAIVAFAVILGAIRMITNGGL